MINHIISFSIRNKFIIGFFTIAIVIGGIYSMKTVHLGSVPDITNNQIQVMTFSPNLGTEDIEQFVTHPVELAMGNIPGVEEMWSISRFGLSVEMARASCRERMHDAGVDSAVERIK